MDEPKPRRPKQPRAACENCGKMIADTPKAFSDHQRMTGCQPGDTAPRPGPRPAHHRHQHDDDDFDVIDDEDF